MKKFWKPFAEWVTGSRHNIFERARLKLTGLYIGILAVILVIFSFTLYYSLAKNIRDNFEGNFSDEHAQELAITKTTDRLKTTIFVIDAAVLLLSSGLSYVLAGRTLKPIQEAMEKQKQFTADASHELRTPLAVARTNLEVALREKEWNSENGRALVASAVDEVKLMTKLAEDLLALAKLEGAERNLTFSKINITEIVEGVVKKMRHLAKERNVLLSFEPSNAVFTHGEALALERLFMNIINNALSFTLVGGAVHVSLYKNHKKAIIRVEDTGVGIAKEDLPRVFERLYRADKARVKSDGAGLGLAIADEIARIHHGSINLESELGKGTIVTIILPAVS